MKLLLIALIPISAFAGYNHGLKVDREPAETINVEEAIQVAYNLGQYDTILGAIE